MRGYVKEQIVLIEQLIPEQQQTSDISISPIERQVVVKKERCHTKLL